MTHHGSVDLSIPTVEIDLQNRDWTITSTCKIGSVEEYKERDFHGLIRDPIPFQ